MFFRKHLVYEAEWSYVEFDNYKLVCASHGGPLALFRDVEKPMLLGAGTLPLSAVHIFSSSGEKRCIINISKMEGMAGLFWTTGLELLCVLDHGYVQRYNLAGEIITDGGFFLGSVAKEQKIVQVYGGKNALVARTSKDRFVLVKDVADPMAKVLPHTEFLQPLASVQLLETTDGYATRVELMVAVGNSVVVIDEYGAEDQLLNLPNPIESMSLSPNGQLLAILDTEGWIRVLSTDLTKHLSAFETGVTRSPRQMAWCGLDAVLLDCMDSLLLIGPYGDSIRYPYEDLVFLKQEIDGARLFSSSKVEFIGRVPTASQSIFQIGSVAPGALLYDAKRYFDEKSIKADENMREIGEENLPIAIKHCIEAGLSEWEPTEQQTLLQAAAYGLAYYKSKSLDPDILKDACQSLRVLNAIREADIGFLITYPQLVQLGMPRILTWLAKSRQHLLALRIAQMIGSGAQDVVLDWALSKIRSEISNGLSDDVLYEALFPKLKSCVGIPIAHIAQYAHTSGRPKLATRILEIESSPSQYVPLYLKLGEDVRALEKSIDSGDEDLIYLCLFHMLKNWQLKDFLKVVIDHPHARDLFISHCRTNEPDLLETTYLYMNKPEGIADACVEQALSRNSGQTLPRSPLPATPQLMERAAKAFTQNKSCLVESKTADDAAKLLRQQLDLENSLSGVTLKGLSLSMTISQLLIVGHEKAALRLKSDFRLTERAFLTIKAASFAETKNWEQLLILARNKRPPLPHDYLVNLAANSGNGGAPRQVLEGLIQCVPDPRQRAEIFSQYNFKSEAEAILQQDKDNEFITRLFAKMGT